MPARIKLGYSTSLNKWIIHITDTETHEEFHNIFDSKEEADATLNHLMNIYRQEIGEEPIHLPNSHMN